MDYRKRGFFQATSRNRLQILIFPWAIWGPWDFGSIVTPVDGGEKTLDCRFGSRNATIMANSRPKLCNRWRWCPASRLSQRRSGAAPLQPPALRRPHFPASCVWVTHFSEFCRANLLKIQKTKGRLVFSQRAGPGGFWAAQRHGDPNSRGKGAKTAFAQLLPAKTDATFLIGGRGQPGSALCSRGPAALRSR
jgi:hypothetical protein